MSSLVLAMCIIQCCCGIPYQTYVHQTVAYLVISGNTMNEGRELRNLKLKKILLSRTSQSV